MEPERLRRTVEDRDPEDVGGQEVARELDARVLEAEGHRERLRQRRFADARDVLDQQMAAREEAGERELERIGFADHDALELRENGGKPLCRGNVGLAQRSDGHGGRFRGR